MATASRLEEPITDARIYACSAAYESKRAGETLEPEFAWRVPAGRRGAHVELEALSAGDFWPIAISDLDDSCQCSLRSWTQHL